MIEARLDEHVLVLRVFQDDDAARIGAYNDVVSVATGEPKGNQSPDGTKDLDDTKHLSE